MQPLSEFHFRQTGKPRLARDFREDHYTPEKFRMECVWKNLLRRYRIRRVPENTTSEIRFEFPRKIHSGFRLRTRPFDSARGARRETASTLELAKGFEPPTL
jgi:hypothetical protein